MQTSLSLSLSSFYFASLGNEEDGANLSRKGVIAIVRVVVVWCGLSLRLLLFHVAFRFSNLWTTWGWGSPQFCPYIGGFILVALSEKCYLSSDVINFYLFIPSNIRESTLYIN